MKYVKLFVVALVLFFLSYIVVASLFVNNSSLAMAEARYTQATLAKNEAECVLVKAKITAWADSKLQLTDEDLLNLNNKRGACLNVPVYSKTPEADKVF
jgi:hypothetical protein